MSALGGLRVIEFGRFIAAPYCCQLLADAGADVIKIEPLAGDDARRNGTRINETEARQFLNKNRNKRSIACNLNDATVKRAILKLLVRADVVVANFRPGQADKLGFGYDTLEASNPRLIYVENSGFGNRGPLGGVAGMDMALQGYSGLAHLSADGPIPLVDPVIDYTAALLMAWGVSTALFHRERTGNGQRLDVSLLQAALVLQNNHINHIDAIDAKRHEFVDYLKTAFSEGASWQDVVDYQRPTGPLQVYYGFFRACDGVFCLAPGSRALQRKVLDVVGLADPAVEQAHFQPDDAPAHAARMKAQFNAVLEQHTAAHWIEVFRAHGVPVSNLNLKPQILDDRQVWANGYLSRIEHPQVGGMTVVSPPVQFSETPLEVRSASPGLGEHTADILAEGGLTAQDIQALAQSGAIVGVN